MITTMSRTEVMTWGEAVAVAVIAAEDLAVATHQEVFPEADDLQGAAIMALPDLQDAAMETEEDTGDPRIMAVLDLQEVQEAHLVPF